MNTITNTATAKQVAFIRRLVEEKDLTGTPISVAVEEGMLDDLLFTIDKRDASSLIENLLSLPRKAAASPAKAEVPEGMHILKGHIYKVQRAVHGSGNLYAKELVRQDEERWTFDYAPGVIRNLSEGTAMTLEQAKEFGALTGTCVYCARELNDERSIEAGYGPVCADKNGLPWG